MKATKLIAAVTAVVMAPLGVMDHCKGHEGSSSQPPVREETQAPPPVKGTKAGTKGEMMSLDLKVSSTVAGFSVYVQIYNEKEKKTLSDEPFWEGSKVWQMRAAVITTDYKITIHAQTGFPDSSMSCQIGPVGQGYQITEVSTNGRISCQALIRAKWGPGSR